MLSSSALRRTSSMTETAPPKQYPCTAADYKLLEEVGRGVSAKVRPSPPSFLLLPLPPSSFLQSAAVLAVDRRIAFLPTPSKFIKKRATGERPQSLASRGVGEKTAKVGVSTFLFL